MVVPWHGVERFSEVCCSLEDNLFGKFFGVAGVSRHKLAQPVEAVVDAGLGQGWNKIIDHVVKIPLGIVDSLFQILVW